MRDLSDAARRPPVAALAYANADAARFRDEAAVGSEAGVAAEHMRLVVRGVEHERTVLVDARISVIADGAAGEVDEFLQVGLLLADRRGDRRHFEAAFDARDLPSLHGDVVARIAGPIARPVAEVHACRPRAYRQPLFARTAPLCPIVEPSFRSLAVTHGGG